MQLGSSQGNFPTASLTLLEKGTPVALSLEHRIRILTLSFLQWHKQSFQGKKIIPISYLTVIFKITEFWAFNGLPFTNTYLLLWQNKLSNFCFCWSFRHADKNIFYSSVVKGYSHLTLNTDMLLGSLPGSLCHPGFRSICLSAKSPFWSVIFHFDTKNAFWSNFSSPLNSRHNRNGNHIPVAMWRFPQFGVYLLCHIFLSQTMLQILFCASFELTASFGVVSLTLAALKTPLYV